MDYSNMTLYELNTHKARLGHELKETCDKIGKRSNYLRSITPVGKKWNNDPELVALKENRSRIQMEMAEIGRLRKVITLETEARERKAQADLDELDVREREVEDIRNMKAASRRPDGTELKYLYEFDNFKGTKRRLAVMMINEIGLQRFLELRRIASWDERHHNNDYYGNSLHRR